ncbi:Nicotinamidase-related amidase [Peptoclostridium litorale DSM 5388]|uniref:Nicotinamidase n=1 Tax=Peptoclostridium litorale DSM 5388 TaxID=1121324 RepID=A0A069REB1_PEPLI|nr:hypothetical protein [Peptoclostridium litorale]KDR93944.1 hypothetical protein CLIT_23c02160 [Peptoclostridium litorale DSM 5388]KDR95371.1 hypothetical protein CLIT_10c00980 [Peptoclostridium litorale DSM 5388]SIN89070.1 Nicotinamidase-related amidase [Peptoclostridium litorale DSM 5388]
MGTLKRVIDDIVDLRAIGGRSDIHPDEVLQKASYEDKIPSSKDEKRVLLLAIDVQNDFMENGSLPVKGSHADVQNLIKFIHSNAGGISKIIASMDTHTYYQIFHPSWWIGKDKQHPEPFTPIRLEDIENGTWMPVKYEKHSRKYVEYLERNAKKTLVIWPYHCLLGTFGNSLEGQFANMAYYHSAVRDTDFEIVVKGTSPLSEMYGIFKPEYDEGVEISTGLLDRLSDFDMILIAGEAKSHCVLESLLQILEYYKDDKPVTENIYILEDCTSSIEGFEDETEKVFLGLEKDYGIKRVNSTDLKL